MVDPTFEYFVGNRGDRPISWMQRRIPGPSGEGGTQVVLGLITWSSTRGAGSFRASPSANPAGLRKRVRRAGQAPDDHLRAVRARAERGPVRHGGRRTGRRRVRG